MDTLGPFPNGANFTTEASTNGTQLPDVQSNWVMIQCDPDASGRVEVGIGGIGGGVLLEPGEVFAAPCSNLRMLWVRGVSAAETVRVQYLTC